MSHATQTARSMTVSAIGGIPLIQTGDDLGQIITEAIHKNDIALENGDVLVLAQKIISKSEGRWVALSSVKPGKQAIDLAQKVDKDPRLVELILSESAEIVAHRQDGVLITAHRLGCVMANAGIDHSNVGDEDSVLLLPKDPDHSARQLKKQFHHLCGVDVHVIINDSFGRVWRHGTAGCAIGVAGFSPLKNYIGKPDLFGQLLRTTQVAVADELAAAASFLMGQADEGSPVVLIRGANLPAADGTVQQLIRPKEEDLFRETSSTLAVEMA
ncbi:coenzyme F420-0:L-glutamate ligase [Mycetohabitans sp. B46]|uniref:coenzyme F420-0:L-glutamate ligase n=1 Tax=Mycetohabitans sp. B46 TaxID=2772536 RepID=UPI00307D5048